MTENKRFYKQKSTIEDYMIYDDDKEDAYFISCKDESDADYLVVLLNELNDENEELKYLLELISRASSFTKEESVKEILRHEIKAIDTVTEDSAMAWHDYCVLSNFFKKQYGEHWDNE